MSYMPGRPEAAVCGEEAPEISIAAVDGSDISLRDKEGKYTLVTFWSKYDAPSRSANHFYASAADDNTLNVRHMGLCTDRRDENLARLITEEDGLDSTSQFVLSQLRADDNSAAYDGRRSATWLVSPQGTVVARNPSAEAIRALKV